MTCNFRVGQKVVCIDASDCEEISPTGARVAPRSMDGLEENRTYTVRDIYFDVGWNAVAIRLVEISRPYSMFRGEAYEAGYDPRRFRPVVERGTALGMSILRNLLNKTGKPVEVDA